MVTALLLSLTTTLPSDTTVLVAGIEMPFVRVEPGAFEREIRPDQFQRVVLTEGFWLGKYEVTQETWQAVMESSSGEGQLQHPARQVSWIEVAEFLERASASVEGWKFRLPTEAEWEYAARAGSTTDWASGQDSLALLDYAWIRVNAGGAVQPVGGRRPNAWGLHDMHGNVWEWVVDWFAPHPKDTQLTDPDGPPTGEHKVFKGGGWSHDAKFSRATSRFMMAPDMGINFVGFRVVLSEFGKKN